jgi:hypothetical protein
MACPTRALVALFSATPKFSAKLKRARAECAIDRAPVGPREVPDRPRPALPVPRYKQASPGAHFALNDPCAVTVLGVLPALVAVKVNVPFTADGDELVITNSPEVELYRSMVPPFT